MRKIIKIRGLFKNIRDLYICYDTIENMPLFLRFITRVSLNGFIVFPIFFLLSLILPLAMGGIHVNGEYFTWQEFWKREEPLVVFAWASWMLLIYTLWSSSEKEVGSPAFGLLSINTDSLGRNSWFPF